MAQLKQIAKAAQSTRTDVGFPARAHAATMTFAPVSPLGRDQRATAVGKAGQHEQNTAAADTADDGERAALKRMALARDNYRTGKIPAMGSLSPLLLTMSGMTSCWRKWLSGSTTRDIMHLLKLMLKASGKKGVPQGGVISPLLSNLYLNEVDKMLERAREVTRNGKYTNVEYARFADDLVVLINAYKRHDWLIGAVNKRLREEFAKLQVEINDEKSRRVDLERGENFGFLGFDFRYLRSLRGVMRPHYTPKLKKRTALLRELKQVFRRHRSQPIERVISLINPMLRGWVNYFAVGNSSECFTYIKDWVEKKVRRHLAQARKRKGFGWERWSRPWLYVTLGLFNSYRVRHDRPKVAPV